MNWPLKNGTSFLPDVGPDQQAGLSHAVPDQNVPLETGTFTIHMEESRLSDTIARAVSAVWAKAEQKELQIDVDCESDVLVRHNAKWTAEALGNILDNAVKYTPAGGSIRIRVRPWQFYTRIDIADTGIGIAEEHYNDVFRRFYRGKRWHRRKGSGLVCTLPAESSPGSTAISASSQNREKEAHSPSIFSPDPCFSP